MERALGEMQALGLTQDDDRWTMSEPGATVKKLKEGGYGPGYNVQMSVDAATGAIIHCEVVNESNDVGQLEPQYTKAQAALDDALGAGRPAPAVVADSGYHDTLDLAALDARGVKSIVPGDHVKNWKRRDVAEAYRADAFAYDPATDTMQCPQGQTLPYRKMTAQRTSRVYQAHAAACAACPAKAQCCPETKHGRSVNRTAYPEILNAVSERTKSDEGKRLKKARSVSVEGVFARMKGLLHWKRCRIWGDPGVNAELAWRSLAHNLMILTRTWQPMALNPVTAQ